MSSRAKEWLIRTVLAVGGPLVLFVFIEGALRVLRVGYDPAFWVAAPESAVTNELFGLRFFSPALLRTPAPVAVRVPKPGNVRRVFLLGESAAMGFPQPALGLAPMLEHMLRQAQPEAGWEVNNAAMTAINSHVILPIARDCARLSPDWIIVFAGNNEAVGPYGPATVFGQAGLPTALARASIFMSGTRTGQQITRLVRREGPREWRGLEMFSQQRIEASDPRLTPMYRAFERNLDDIVHSARSAGAEVLLVTVPVNLRDFEPFAPSGADFAQGRELLRAGKTADAEVSFRRARDRDALRFRADTRINEIVRETARRQKTRLVDADRSFGLGGSDLFWEHVHLTPLGTFRLAGLVAEQMGVSTSISYQQVRASLPITKWDERQISLQIAALLGQPPFTSQPGNKQRMHALRVDDDGIALRSEARVALERAALLRPHDVPLLGRYAEVLRESGEPRASAEILGRMIRIVPGRKAWHAARGAVLSEAGSQDEAIHEYNTALRLDSRFDLAHFGKGLAKARQGKHEDAVRYYEEALRLTPAYAEAAYNLAGSLTALRRDGEAKRMIERSVASKPDFTPARAALAQIYARQGRDEEAIEQYLMAVRGEPPLPEAHYDLALLLARRGQHAEAVEHYRRAIELKPAYPEALNNLGIAYARSGDSTAAARAFERALAVQPSFEAARSNLQRIRRTIAGKP